jgi:hypothetical protein
MQTLDRPFLLIQGLLMLLTRACTELKRMTGSTTALIITMMGCWTPISPVCQYRTDFQFHVTRLNTCPFKRAV